MTTDKTSLKDFLKDNPPEPPITLTLTKWQRDNLAYLIDQLFDFGFLQEHIVSDWTYYLRDSILATYEKDEEHYKRVASYDKEGYKALYDKLGNVKKYEQ